MALEWCQEVPALSRRTSLLLNARAIASTLFHPYTLAPFGALIAQILTRLRSSGARRCQEVPALSRRTSLLLNTKSESSECIYCVPLIPLHPQVP